MNVIDARQVNTPKSSYANSVQHQLEQFNTNSPNKNNADTFSLSEAGRSALSNEAALSQLALPNWYTEFSVPSLDLTSSSAAIKEGAQLVALSEQYSADGHVTAAEQQAIASYRHHMSANQQLLAHDQFNQTHQQQIDEYTAIKQDAMAAAKAALGLDNDSFLPSLHDPNSAALGEQFKAIMLANPKAVTLMNTLGVKPK
ncbi:hypothetical protein [Thalassotalea euphylliae]|uniref:Uncharacterized protein n=1 Tax=Thalassotalea euphylliae TaxID=1655234 RepID=A0A3E0UGU7_9GAMM|nr:hypothetical protein [Thalassotalea euphylliae]REL34972.1 hypothetical protein DXX92_06095 [Thalassotalea euphylliae]